MWCEIYPDVFDSDREEPACELRGTHDIQGQISSIFSSQMKAVLCFKYVLQHAGTFENWEISLRIQIWFLTKK